MFKKISLAGVLLIMCLGIFAGCKPKEIEEPYVPKKYGDFYTLEDAYEQGLLTLDDLKNIAYYQNEWYYQGEEIESPDFEPKPKDPEVLSEEIERMIKETMAFKVLHEDQVNIRPDHFFISKYYGIYNDCVAVMIEGYYVYNDAERDVEIDGVVFHYTRGNSIVIWKEN